MWRLKSCPRCGGDLYIDNDFDGWFEQCLQCSYRQQLRSLAEASKPQREREKEPVAARMQRK